MAAKNIIVVLALLVHNGLCDEYPRWLTDNRASLGSKPFNELVLIEAHDAGTYALKGYDERPENDPFAPDDDNIFIDIGVYITPGLVLGWSRTQYQNIYEQLKGGIRAIDIRVCADKNGTLLTCHGLYGSPIEEVVTQVRQFSTENPGEFLVLSFNSFHGWNQDTPGQLSNEKHKELQELINSALGTVMIDHTKIDRPTLKLNTMWDMQAQYGFGSVIVIYDHSSNPGSYWSGSLKQSTWKNTWDYNMKKQSLIDNLAKVDKTLLTSFSGAATPDAKLVALCFNPIALNNFHYPTNLRELADNTNPPMLGWVLADDVFTTGRIGMVGMDFVNTTCAVKIAMKKSGVPNISLDKCQIGSKTFWDDWHALYPCPPPLVDDLTLLYCQKPAAETRPGYPWKFGDKPFDLSAAKARCEKVHGVGGCELNGAIYYPKCRSSYHNVGCCVCSYDCPKGMPDAGQLCQK